MNSLPTISQANLDQYWDVVRRLDPQLFMIKVALQETGVNPEIMPRFIRSVAVLAMGTGYGTIRTFMQNKVVTQIKAEESDQLNLQTYDKT